MKSINEEGDPSPSTTAAWVHVPVQSGAFAKQSFPDPPWKPKPAAPCTEHSNTCAAGPTAGATLMTTACGLCPPPEHLHQKVADAAERELLASAASDPAYVRYAPEVKLTAAPATPH